MHIKGVGAGRGSIIAWVQGRWPLEIYDLSRTLRLEERAYFFDCGYPDSWEDSKHVLGWGRGWRHWWLCFRRVPSLRSYNSRSSLLARYLPTSRRYTDEDHTEVNSSGNPGHTEQRIAESCKMRPFIPFIYPLSPISPAQLYFPGSLVQVVVLCWSSSSSDVIYFTEGNDSEVQKLCQCICIPEHSPIIGLVRFYLTSCHWGIINLS